MRAGALCLLLAAALGAQAPAPGDPLRDVRETHLKQVRQLTREGSSSDARWSAAGDRIVFQGVRPGWPCEQLYSMKADGSEPRRLSSGKGRAVTGSFLPGDRQVLFASSHGAGDDCPRLPGMLPGSNLLPLFPGYDLYLAEADGGAARPLLPAPGYDGGAALAPNGKWLLFTSERVGDLDLWRADLDGGNLLRLTDRLGYDGEGAFSGDSSRIVWCSGHPEGAEAEAYRARLQRHLVAPGNVDLWLMNADGSGKRQLTRLKGTVLSPVFAPGDKAVLFASNHHDREGRGRGFDLFRIDLDGSHLERLTFTGGYNAFPHFSPDGSQLLWTSGRAGAGAGQYQIFRADWIK